MMINGKNVRSLSPDFPEFNFFSTSCEDFVLEYRQCEICTHILYFLRNVIIIQKMS